MASGLLASTLALLTGLVYLSVAGAPATMLMVNVGAYGAGLLLLWAVLKTGIASGRWLLLWPWFAAASAIATALLGREAEGVTRWFMVAGMAIQPSLILMPAAILSFARHATASSMVALLLLTLALSLQPDNATSGAMAVGCLLLFGLNRGKFQGIVALFSIAAFAFSIVQNINPSAVPFVDHVLLTAFEHNILIGAAMWTSCLILLLPAIVVLKIQKGPAAQHLVFGVTWLALVIAAALDAYPTPFVGYGASPIIGYLICLALLVPSQKAQTVSDIHSRSGKMDADADDDKRSPLLAWG